MENWSAGESILRIADSATTVDACCAQCIAEPECAVFVFSTTCYLKRDGNGGHAKSGNTCGYVRAPAPKEPQWVVVESTPAPVIDEAMGLPYNIFNGFETGQYQRINGTYYLTANELGMCPKQVWDKITRAALWSAPNSTGPWTRLTTLRNASHMYSYCKDTPYPYPGSENLTDFVTWTPQLIFGPSSVNTSQDRVWNLFYSSNQNRDGRFNGISWAVSTTDSLTGPYVDVRSVGPDAVAVNYSHSFAAWQLPNGTWVGFKNSVPGAKPFSVGLIVPVDPNTPGGEWRAAGPNIAVDGGIGAGMHWAPENPYVRRSSDGKLYYAVYDALKQPPGNSTESQDLICRNATACDRIGMAWSVDGLAWTSSDLLKVQTKGHACGQIRTPLGLAPEPELCRGCYSVLWTGIQNGSDGFRPVCHAIIRNLNE